MPARSARKPTTTPARPRGTRGTPLPETFQAQLATLVKEAPQGDDWVHELKFDGYRIGCRVDGAEVQLLSRNGKDWTANFPEVRQAAAKLAAHRALLDGEVAMVLPDGKTSFQALQNVHGGGERKGLTYFVFDLLHLDGEDIGRLPLEQRKERLRALLSELPSSTLLRFSDHVVGGGPAFHQQACQMGLEGIISKKRGCPYQPGRNPTWVKTKCIQRQELVVGGFTDPEGAREGIGALLVGTYQRPGQLVFAGKVGTGFTQKVARELRRKLETLARRDCPFSPRPEGWLGRNAHWVDPKLVAEVAFTEWTDDGKIRHPSFQGLREDKKPEEVMREMPIATKPTEERRKTGRHKAVNDAPPVPISRVSKPTAQVAGVRITNPDRVLFTDAGMTKLDLALYYESLAACVLPQVIGRPLTLVRCPHGVQSDGRKDCFYMKHSHVWAPPALRRVNIPEKTKMGEYLVADDLAGVISLVQMDVLEIHTWNAQADDVERPDRVVFDLDPGPDVSYDEVIETARLVREALEALDLESFVKTTGGKGLHIVVPLDPGPGWDVCFEFTRALATGLVRQRPQDLTIAMPKAGREKKILIDYLRNNRTATSVAAYSSRARPDATVSMPLAWDELSRRLPPDHFDLTSARKRVRGRVADPWERYGKVKQRLRPALVDAVARVVG